MSEQPPDPTTASGDTDPGTDGDAGPDPDDGGSDPNGPAVPDDEGAAAAQDGVQQAFGVAPQD